MLSRTLPLWRVVFLVVVGACILSCFSRIAVAKAPGDTISSAHGKLLAEYRQQLAVLAEEASAEQNNYIADRINGWLPPEVPFGIVLFDPNSHVSNLNKSFKKIRNEQADKLFVLAQLAAKAGEAALALQLAAETVRENPNHAEARRVLGFVHVEGLWKRPYAQRKAKAGYVWHERFGWIRSSDIQKYEEGKRPRGQGWVAAEDDAQKRQSIDKGWLIRTEHFNLATNDSLEGGVQLASKLEVENTLWRQLFAEYYLRKQDVVAIFAGERSLPRARKPHQVRYYKTRGEYNSMLVRQQPKIGMTLGIYFDKQRTAHFFQGKDQAASTIYHEVSHQLFQENSRKPRRVGMLDNFWVVEAIATYFESLRPLESPGAFALGGKDAGRMPAARQRLLEDGFYVPLAELVALGKDDFQQREDIRPLYSQIAGLATFFMHAENGKYRRPMVQYLHAVYHSHADEKTLSKLTGKAYAELDSEYRTFMEASQ